MNRGGSARSVETVILAALVDIPRVILFPKAVMTSRNFWLRSALALSLGFYSDADYHSIVCPLWLPRGHSHSPAHHADQPVSSAEHHRINRYRGGGLSDHSYIVPTQIQ